MNHKAKKNSTIEIVVNRKGESLMKAMRYVPFVLGLLTLTGVSTVLADGKQVTITNGTSYTMSQFYASDSNASGWDISQNLLSSSISPGQTKTVSISGGDGVCNYDLMAVLDGSEQYAYNYSVDACDGGSNWDITQN